MSGLFGGRPLVAGSISGLRSFELTKDGHLTGVMQQQKFAPGVNQAVCTRVTNWGCQVSKSSFTTTKIAPNLYTELPAARAMTCARYHSKTGCPLCNASKRVYDAHYVAKAECSCGFYAYMTDDVRELDYSGFGRITGVVEGTGIVTVGNLGFRAARMEIKAVVIPRIDQIMGFVFNRKFVVIPLVLALFVLFVSTNLFIDALTARIIVNGSMGAIIGNLGSHLFSSNSKRKYDKVKQNYPDVKVYTSVEKMLAAHPVSERPAV